MRHYDFNISVLIPAYNHASYIEDALRSIFEQGYSDCEVIVLDDGSTDHTYTVAKQLCDDAPITMRVYTRENRGLVKTLNELTNLSSGRFLYFLASDDMLAPGALMTIATEMEHSPQLKIIYGNGLYFYQGQAPEGKLYSDELLSVLKGTVSDVRHYLYTNVSNILTQSSVICRDFLDEVGGFNEKDLLDDWPHHIRVFKKLANDFEWKFIDYDFVYYRRHDSNMSRNITKQYQQITDTVNKYVPEEYRNRLLAKSYFNLGLVALLKLKAQGVKLLWLSQKMEPNVGRLLQIPMFFGKAIYNKIVKK